MPENRGRPFTRINRRAGRSNTSKAQAGSSQQCDHLLPLMNQGRKDASYASRLNASVGSVGSVGSDGFESRSCFNKTAHRYHQPLSACQMYHYLGLEYRSRRFRTERNGQAPRQIARPGMFQAVHTLDGLVRAVCQTWSVTSAGGQRNHTNGRMAAVELRKWACGKDSRVECVTKLHGTRLAGLHTAKIRPKRSNGNTRPYHP